MTFCWSISCAFLVGQLTRNAVVWHEALDAFGLKVTDPPERPLTVSFVGVILFAAGGATV